MHLRQRKEKTEHLIAKVLEVRQFAGGSRSLRWARGARQCGWAWSSARRNPPPSAPPAWRSAPAGSPSPRRHLPLPPPLPPLPPGGACTRGRRRGGRATAWCSRRGRGVCRATVWPRRRGQFGLCRRRRKRRRWGRARRGGRRWRGGRGEGGVWWEGAWGRAVRARPGKRRRRGVIRRRFGRRESPWVRGSGCGSGDRGEAREGAWGTRSCRIRGTSRSSLRAPPPSPSEEVVVVVAVAAGMREALIITSMRCWVGWPI